MKDTTKLVATGTAVALIALLWTGAAASADDGHDAETRYAQSGHALPPLVAAVERAAVTEQRAAEARMPDGHRWQQRPESIFGGRSLVLPAGTWLAPWQAAEALGTNNLADSTWPAQPVPGGRVPMGPSGWMAGAGGWAMIQEPTNGVTNRILYVQWE